MKIIKSVFYILLALGMIACAGIFILFQTFDTDKFLPQLTQQASHVLGRPVSVEHVGLGLSSRGITLDAWPLIVADDPDFTSQPFIKIDRVRISLDLKLLVLQGKIHIRNILLQSPQIHFIRSQDGIINARSIGQKGQISSVIASACPAKGGEAKRSLDSKQITMIPAASAKESIKSITIQDASISYIDQAQGMPMDVWLKNINAGLNDPSFSKPMQLSFNASPLVFKSTSPGKQDNPVFSRVTGVIRLNGPKLEGDIIISDGVIKNFNMVKEILSRAVKSFNGLDEMVNKLGADDTNVQKAEAKFLYHDKTVYFDDLLVQTNILEFNAQGSIDQGLNIDMQTMLHLNADISTSLINQLDGLKYLCDDSKRIAIGGSLEGVYPHLKYRSDKDFKKKSKKVFNAMFRQLLGA